MSLFRPLYSLLHGNETVVAQFKSGWEVTIKTPSRYTKMSLERRISVFNPRVLLKVEEAYHWFSIVSEGFIVEFNRYLKKEITVQQLRDT